MVCAARHPSMRFPVTVTCVDKDSDRRMSSRLISVSGMEMSWMKRRSLVVERVMERSGSSSAIRSSRVVLGADREFLGGWEWCWRSEGGHVGQGQRSIPIVECL